MLQGGIKPTQQFESTADRSNEGEGTHARCGDHALGCHRPGERGAEGRSFRFEENRPVANSYTNASSLA